MRITASWCAASTMFSCAFRAVATRFRVMISLASSRVGAAFQFIVAIGPNAQDLRRHPERIIEVHWADTAPSGKVSFNVEILIEALDRLNLLLDVAKVFADNGANVLSVSSTTHRDSMVEMRFLFQVSDTTAISRILQRLQSVEGVFEARRMMPNATSDSK